MSYLNQRLRDPDWEPELDLSPEFLDDSVDSILLFAAPGVELCLEESDRNTLRLLSRSPHPDCENKPGTSTEHLVTGESLPVLPMSPLAPRPSNSQQTSGEQSPPVEGSSDALPDVE
jgi:hypothetical protein